MFDFSLLLVKTRKLSHNAIRCGKGHIIRRGRILVVVVLVACVVTLFRNLFALCEYTMAWISNITLYRISYDIDGQLLPVTNLTLLFRKNANFNFFVQGKRNFNGKERINFYGHKKSYIEITIPNQGTLSGSEKRDTGGLLGAKDHIQHL